MLAALIFSPCSLKALCSSISFSIVTSPPSRFFASPLLPLSLKALIMVSRAFFISGVLPSICCCNSSCKERCPTSCSTAVAFSLAGRSDLSISTMRLPLSMRNCACAEASLPSLPLPNCNPLVMSKDTPILCKPLFSLSNTDVTMAASSFATPCSSTSVFSMAGFSCFCSCLTSSIPNSSSNIFLSSGVSVTPVRLL